MGGLAAALRPWGSPRGSGSGAALAGQLPKWGSLGRRRDAQGAWEDLRIGAWEDEPSEPAEAAKRDFGAMMEGLQPGAGAKRGMALSTEVSQGTLRGSGRFFADWTTELEGATMLNLRVSDEHSWVASLLGANGSLWFRGRGWDLGSIDWRAARESSVEGLGDVKLEFDSSKAYNLTVRCDRMPEIAGVQLSAKALATRAGVGGGLAARRLVLGRAQVSYGVQNPVGVYRLGKRTRHTGRLRAPVYGGVAALDAVRGAGAEAYQASFRRHLGGGEADAHVSWDAKAARAAAVRSARGIAKRDAAGNLTRRTARGAGVGFNVSYTRSLPGAMLEEVASAQVGLDDSGAYGRLAAARDLGHGAEARYEALARLGRVRRRKGHLRHALRVWNRHACAHFAHGRGEAPRLRLSFDLPAAGAPIDVASGSRDRGPVADWPSLAWERARSGFRDLTTFRQQSLSGIPKLPKLELPKFLELPKVHGDSERYRKEEGPLG